MIRLYNAAIVIGLLFFISGCAKYVVNDPTDIYGPNHSLLYLPWWDSDSDADKPGDLPDGLKKPGSFDLQPGMKLIIRSMPISEQNTNILTFAPTVFEWIVPAAVDDYVRYTREDFFLLNWLMIMGRSDQSSNRDAQFAKLGNDLPKNSNNDFAALLGKAAIGRWSNPVYWRDRIPIGDNCCSPQAVLIIQSIGSVSAPPFNPSIVKTRLCGATRKDFTNLSIARELNMSVDLRDEDGDVITHRFSVLDGDDWFFQNNLRSIQVNNSLNHKWYNPDICVIHGARAEIEVQIAVRLSDETISRYFPACMTVSDFEERLGKQIKAVRRSEDNLKWFHIKETTQEKLFSDIVGYDPADRYATFYFQKQGSYFKDAFGKHGILINPDLKDKFIVGHRDVLLLNSARLSGSDNPGIF